MNKIFILLAFLISANLYAGYPDIKKDIDDIQEKMSILNRPSINQNYPNKPANHYQLRQYSQICYTMFGQCYLPENQVLLNQQCWCQNPYTGFIDYGIAR